jgi:chromosome segregation ATPase
VQVFLQRTWAKKALLFEGKNQGTENAAKLKALDKRLEELGREERETEAQLQALDRELEDLKTNKTPGWRKAQEEFDRKTAQLGKLSLSW